MKNVKHFWAHLAVMLITLFGALGIAASGSAQHVFADRMPASLAASSSSSSSSGSGDNNGSSSAPANNSSTDSFAQAASQLAQAYNDDSKSDYTSIFNAKQDNSGNIMGFMGPGNNILSKANLTTYCLDIDDGSSSANTLRGKANKAIAFGSLLDTMGIDHAYTNGSTNTIFTRCGRLVGGGAYLLGYAACVASNWLFGEVAHLVSYINPANWFIGNIDNNSPFAGIANTVHAYAQDAAKMGLVFWSVIAVIGILLAAAGFRFSENQTHVSAGQGAAAHVVNLFIRVFAGTGLMFILAGVIAGTFTWISNMYANNSVGCSAYPVYSNFVDFKNGVEHNNLGLPSSLNGRIPVTFDMSQAPVLPQQQVLAFNAQTAGDVAAANTANSTKGASAAIDNNSVTNSNVEEQNNAVFHLLMDWTLFRQYTGADYASFVRDHCGSDYKAMNSASKAVGLLSGKGTGDANPNGNTNQTKYISNGTLTDNGHYYQTSGVNVGVNNNGGTNGNVVEANVKGAFSTMGMYNYLHYQFSPTGGTLVNNPASQTNFYTVSHASVGLASRGLNSFSRWLLGFAQLVAIGLFGILTAISSIVLLFVGVSKFSAYGIIGLFGSFGGIVKTVVAAAMLILEFAGGAIWNLIAGQLINDVAMASDSLFNVSNTLAQAGTSAVAIHNPLQQHLVGASVNAFLFSAVNIGLAGVIIWLALKLWGLRGIILRSINDMAERTISMILGSVNRHGGGGGFRTDTLGNSMAANGNSYNSNGSNDTFGTNSALTGDNFNRVGGATGGAAAGIAGGRSQFSRTPRISNPTGLTNRFKNGQANIKDDIKAAEAAKGRPLSKGEKAAIVARNFSQGVGNSVRRGIAKTANSPTMMKHAAAVEERQQLARSQRLEDASNQQGTATAQPAPADVNDSLAAENNALTQEAEASQAEASQLQAEADKYDAMADHCGDETAAQAFAAKANDLRQQASEAQNNAAALQGKNGMAQQAQAVNNAVNKQLQAQSAKATPAQAQAANDLRNYASQNTAAALDQVNTARANANENLRTAKADLMGLQHQGLHQGETQAQRQAAIANAQQKVNDAQKAVNMTNAAAHNVAAAMPYRSANATVARNTNGHVTTNAEAMHALQQVQSAQNALAAGSKQASGSQLMTLSQNLAQARQHAANLGLSSGLTATASSTQHALDNLQQTMTRVSDGAHLNRSELSSPQFSGNAAPSVATGMAANYNMHQATMPVGDNAPR